MFICFLAVLNHYRVQRILKTWIFLKKIVVKLIASWTQLKCFADVQQMEKSLNSRAERDFRVICLRAVPEDLVYKMGFWSPMLQGLC